MIIVAMSFLVTGITSSIMGKSTVARLAEYHCRIAQVNSINFGNAYLSSTFCGNFGQVMRKSPRAGTHAKVRSKAILFPPFRAIVLAP